MGDILNGFAKDAGAIFYDIAREEVVEAYDGFAKEVVQMVVEVDAVGILYDFAREEVVEAYDGFANEAVEVVVEVEDVFATQEGKAGKVQEGPYRRSHTLS